MSSTSGVLSVGAQQPRLTSVPEYVTSGGDEAIELAAAAKLHLDPWEQLVLRDALGETIDGRWAATEVGIVAPRQNGKDAILETRELGGLFLFGERLLVHSAHEQRTSSEHFRRLVNLIEEAGFQGRLKGNPKWGKGSESIELKSGQRIMFVTRTSGGGRGLTGDLIVLNEAMIIRDSAMDALVPTMAALSMEGSPQLWYAGSAVDREKHEHGRVLAGVRARGISGEDPMLAYFEWSAEGEDPSDVPDEVASDPEVWAQANPGFGIRISQKHIESEKRQLSRRGFATERLGIGDWPALEDEDPDAITRAMWAACRDPRSDVVGQVCFAPDVSPNRSTSSISVAGFRPDGKFHVGVGDRRVGTDWIVDRLVELTEKNDTGPIPYDGNGPIAALKDEMEAAGLRLRRMDSQDMARACGQFYDAVKQEQLRHGGAVALDTAVYGASRRSLGDAWAWARKTSSADITPLVSCTAALWAIRNERDIPFVFEILD